MSEVEKRSENKECIQNLYSKEKSTKYTHNRNKAESKPCIMFIFKQFRRAWSKTEMGAPELVPSHLGPKKPRPLKPWKGDNSFDGSF